MKPLRTILLFLLLGAVVNVAVAWGCALWSSLTELEFLTQDTYGLREGVEWLPDDMFIVTSLQQGFGCCPCGRGSRSVARCRSRS